MQPRRADWSWWRWPLRVAVGALLVVDTFGMWVWGGMAFRTDEMRTVAVLGALGIVSLWVLYVVQFVMRRVVSRTVMAVLCVGLVCGTAAVVTITVSSARTGIGFAGFGFGAWAIWSVLFGGPVVVGLAAVLDRARLRRPV